MIYKGETILARHKHIGGCYGDSGGGDGYLVDDEDDASTSLNSSPQDKMYDI